MIIKEKSEKRIFAGNIALLSTVFILTNALWHFYSWYEVMAPYGTLVAAIGLTITLFCYVDIKEMVKDPAFLLMAAGDLIALINLFFVGSNKGAILTVFDFLLVFYLANKIKLSNKQVIISALYLGFYFLYWTIDVKGYFKGYNTNYGGLVLISGFFFIVYAIDYLRHFLIRVKKISNAKYILFAEIFFFAWGYNIIAWYRSRCALLGLIGFAVILLMPKRVWNNRLCFNLAVFATTIGSILFSLLYVWLGVMKDVFSIRIFYKDIISGREEIWSLLWTAFIKQPVTGIGSSYEIKLDWLNGMFEVHNGLLDILIVHGIPVFSITIVFVIKRFSELYDYTCKDSLSRCAMAGVFAMMLPAFMENYIIVAPYMLMLLILMSTVRTCMIPEET